VSAGLSVACTGTVISQEILDFLTLLDIKEIHGYRAELGLPVLTEGPLTRLPAAGVDDDARVSKAPKGGPLVGH
jgi:hypothetical protein